MCQFYNPDPDHGALFFILTHGCKTHLFIFLKAVLYTFVYKAIRNVHFDLKNRYECKHSIWLSKNAEHYAGFESVGKATK